jgi:hypothetical protein
MFNLFGRTRAGIDRAKLHPHRLVIIVDLHGCLDDPS